MLDLSGLLVPEKTGEGLYRGPTGPSFGSRLFGGQAFAQALMAGSLAEKDGRLAHSVHAYFLKAGAAAAPMDLSVTPLTEGRSFATRRIEGSQGNQVNGGATIFTMVASFHRAEEGWRHAADISPPIGPEDAQQRFDEWAEANRHGPLARMIDRFEERPVDVIPFDPATLYGSAQAQPASGWWMRLRRPVEPDPALQRAVLAYASDMMLLRTAMLPHGIRPFSRGVQTASLDHAIWFHDTPDMDDWLLFETDSPWAGHARGLSQGHFFTAQGRLVASVAQESLMRMRRPPTPD